MCDKAYSIVPNSSSCLAYALVHCTIIMDNMVLGTIQYIAGSRIALQFFLGFVQTKPYWMHAFCHNLCVTRVGQICFKWNHNCYNNYLCLLYGIVWKNVAKIRRWEPLWLLHNFLPIFLIRTVTKGEESYPSYDFIWLKS